MPEQENEFERLYPPEDRLERVRATALAEGTAPTRLYSHIIETICGAVDDSQDVELYDGSLGVTTEFVDSHQSMVGNVQWNNNLATIYTNPGTFSGRRWGTGTLISDNLFLTAGHLFDSIAGVPLNNTTGVRIPPAEIARNMRVNFNYQLDENGNPRVEQPFAITDLVEYRLGGVDFAIVRLAGNPRPAFGVAVIGTGDPPTNDEICIIGHPAGVPKRIEAGRILAYSGNQVQYNDIDTLGGNSGSPIYAELTGMLIGVHTNGGCTSTGGFNFGMRISSIIRWSPTVQSIVAVQAPAMVSEPSLKVVDVSGISRDNGANVHQWEYLAGPNQRFRPEHVGNLAYRLRADHSGKVLDVSGVSQANGANIHQWDWWDGPNQRFRMERVNRGYRRFVASHSNKVIDVADFSWSSGAQIWQWDWLNGPNQRFRFLSGPIFPEHSRKALDLAGFSQDPLAPLIQWSYHGDVNQLFHFDPLDDGTYRIVLDHSGLVLDVENASIANGAAIVQYPWHGGRNQRFFVDAVGGGSVRIIAAHSGKVLDVAGASRANGVRVIQWDWLNGQNQRFRLFTTPIRAAHSNKAIDVGGVSIQNGAAVTQFDSWGGHNQRFFPDRLPDGSFRFIAEHSGKVLDVVDYSQANGGRIHQWQWHGDNNQRFRLEPLNELEYRIVSVHSGKVLDVAGGSTDNGALIIQWDWLGGGNQKWTLG